jgi:hypothetical protein
VSCSTPGAAFQVALRIAEPAVPHQSASGEGAALPPVSAPD